MRLKYIPNYLSVLRLLMIIAFVYFFFSSCEGNYIIASVVYLLAGLTDILDGWLARRYNWLTRLGRILDPMADKLLQLTVLICLGIKELLPFWLIIPFILKEAIHLLLGYLMIRKRNVVVKSSWYGKAVTVLMCISAVMVLLFAGMIDEIRIYVEILYAALLAFTIMAILLYVHKYIGIKSENEIDEIKANVKEGQPQRTENK